MIEYRDKYLNLIYIIFSDLFFNCRLSLILLFFIVISGISVVVITYKTKELVFLREKIVLEKDALEIENRHLILEEKVLSDFSRIEYIASKQLGMKHVDFHEKNLIYFYD